MVVNNVTVMAIAIVHVAVCTATKVREKMKLTKTYLKKLIKEELAKEISESELSSEEESPADWEEEEKTLSPGDIYDALDNLEIDYTIDAMQHVPLRLVGDKLGVDEKQIIDAFERFAGAENDIIYHISVDKEQRTLGVSSIYNI